MQRFNFNRRARSSAVMLPFLSSLLAYGFGLAFGADSVFEEEAAALEDWVGLLDWPGLFRLPEVLTDLLPLPEEEALFEVGSEPLSCLPDASRFFSPSRFQ